MTGKPLRVLGILLLAAGLRLLQVDAPPIGRHAWRQCDTASVARNYHHQGYRFFYPQIDWEIPGYVEMEFPLYPYAVALAYARAGPSEALARLLAALGSLAALALIYLLVRRISGEGAALWAAFFFAVLPSSMFFGRAIMPESWVLAASVAAVYCFLRWHQEGSWLWLTLSATATALACLLKLTSLYLGLPLLWLAWRHYGRRTLARLPMWLFALAVGAPVVAWYAWSYHLGEAYGASFHILTAAGVDKWGRWSLLTELEFYRRVFVDILGGRILTWAGWLLLLIALCLPRRRPLERLFDLWLLAIVVVLLLANFGSYHHDYYSLPMLLPAVALMGKACDLGWSRRRLLTGVAVGLLLVLSGYRYGRDLMAERLGAATDRPLTDELALARLLQARTRSSDLIISCSAANPVMLYLAERRGWGRGCGQLDKAELQELVARGARYLVGRATDLRELPGRRLGDYLRTFGTVVSDDAGGFLVDLTDLADVDSIAWRAVFRQSFAGDRRPVDWQFDSRRWVLRDNGLHGWSRRRSTLAVASPAFAGCDLCRIEVDIGAVRWATPRAKPRVAVTGWWVDEGTGVTATLSFRDHKIRLQQHAGGRRLHSVSVPRALETGRIYRLELRFDLFDFELLLDGESLLTAASRFDSPPFGTVGLQARRAEARVEGLRVLGPGAPAP